MMTGVMRPCQVMALEKPAWSQNFCQCCGNMSVYERLLAIDLSR